MSWFLASLRLGYFRITFAFNGSFMLIGNLVIGQNSQQLKLNWFCLIKESVSKPELGNWPYLGMNLDTVIDHLGNLDMLFELSSWVNFRR